MRAKTLNDLLKAGDRVAVSNITGREASTVTVASQRYCGNVVGGWALEITRRVIHREHVGEHVPHQQQLHECPHRTPQEAPEHPQLQQGRYEARSENQCGAQGQMECGDGDDAHRPLPIASR